MLHRREACCRPTHNEEQLSAYTWHANRAAMFLHIHCRLWVRPEGNQYPHWRCDPKADCMPCGWSTLPHRRSHRRALQSIAPRHGISRCAVLAASPGHGIPPRTGATRAASAIAEDTREARAQHTSPLHRQHSAQSALELECPVCADSSCSACTRATGKTETRHPVSRIACSSVATTTGSPSGEYRLRIAETGAKPARPVPRHCAADTSSRPAAGALTLSISGML